MIRLVFMLSGAARFIQWPYKCVTTALGSSDVMFVATLFWHQTLCCIHHNTVLLLLVTGDSCAKGRKHITICSRLDESEVSSAVVE